MKKSDVDKKKQAERVLRVNQPTPFDAPLTSAPASFNRPQQRVFANPKPIGAAGVRDRGFSKEIYRGEDLMPFTGREGALTAYAIPSKGTLC